MLPTGNITELLDVARVIMKTLETAESESNGRRKLTRLHVLSDLFQLTIHKQRLDSRDGERWNDARAATARACLLAANLTCRARDIDLLAPLKALSQQQPDAAAKHQQQQQQQKKSEEVEEEVLAEEDSERPMSVGAAAGSGDGADADAKRRREADAAAEPQRPRLTTGWREQHYSTVLPYSNFGRARRPVPNDELHCWVERYYDFCICPVVRCAQPDVDDATDAGSSDARGAHHQHNAGVKHLATHDHIELDWAAIAAHALAAQL